VICTFGAISLCQQRQLLETQKEKLGAELSVSKAQVNPRTIFIHFLNPFGPTCFNNPNTLFAATRRPLYQVWI
jgi:hypothetical protein